MNILVLSSVYPRNNMEPGEACTKVVHEFAVEWQKQGHNVLVIHCMSRYPVAIHALSQTIRTKIKSKSGVEISPVEVIRKEIYEYNGIKVYRRPYLKLIPHGKESCSTIKSMCSDIEEYLKEEHFAPDAIVGHWASPQAPLLVELKNKFDCKTALVLHGVGYVDNKSYGLKKYIRNIDQFGCRSRSEAEYTFERLGLESMPFICYSGIPDSYCKKPFNGNKIIGNSSIHVICVSELIKRKNVDSVINAVVNMHSQGADITLDIVGIGFEMKTLLRLISANDAEKYIKMHGRIPRDQVVKLMDKANCFVLNSKNEVFGLVYLEAMAASCITIGSKKEGIDGIIENGKNGYLVTPGDTQELVSIFRKIGKETDKVKCDMAYNGYLTAQRFTNSKMAQDYLDKILGKCNYE